MKLLKSKLKNKSKKEVVLFCPVFKEGRTAKLLEHVSSAKFFPYFPYKRRVMLDKENLDKHVTISCELEFKKKI